MVEFKRKQSENFEGFLRRFNRTLIKSRKLALVRSKKFLTKKKNKLKQKDQALKTIDYKKRDEYLMKIGKIKEDPRRKW
ncbi:hypothetical protein KAI92_00910 [Candidatus Parcubacteria bacterium]|nr:hypothetical protein [Candidatus Parcubacteria bacterium]